MSSGPIRRGRSRTVGYDIANMSECTCMSAYIALMTGAGNSSSET